MNRLFIADHKQTIYNCYNDQQIGQSEIVTRDELKANMKGYEQIEYVFSTWGMIDLTKEEITTYFPKLKCIFYGAGSVAYFAKPFLESGVRVFSAWAANAIPVAEFTVAQIILANKGFFQLHSRYRKQGFSEVCTYGNTFPSNYHTNVGLLGVGMISRHVIKLLQAYQLNIYVTSDYLTEAAAKEMGVTVTDMEFIFQNCQTISNHLANKPETVGVINKDYFSLMKSNATFINTGRGAQVNEDDLIQAMLDEPGRTALLDVTDPKEPLDLEDKIWEMPNVFITPHRAGSVTDEIQRMGDYAYGEYLKIINGEEPSYEVTIDMLKTMA